MCRTHGLHVKRLAATRSSVLEMFETCTDMVLYKELSMSGYIWTCFYRATACNATHGIAVGILSVRLSVRPSDACIVTKLNNALRIF